MERGSKYYPLVTAQEQYPPICMIYTSEVNMLLGHTFLVRLVYLLSDRNECCVYDRYYSIAKYNFVAGTQY